MKLVGRGDTTVVDAYLSPILRRYVDRGGRRRWAARGSSSCSRMAGLTDAQRFRGKDAILSGPAGGIVGAVRDGGAGPGSTRSSASTWAAPRPTCRHFAGEYERALRDRGGRRAHAGADDAHPHGRGGRRLDLPLRRRALPRGPAIGGRQSRPGLLSPRRPADGDRLQRDAGQAAAGLLPGGVRPERRPAARRRGRARRNSRRSRARSRRRPATGARRRRWPKASCASPSRTWRMPSSRSRSSAAMT